MRVLTNPRLAILLGGQWVSGLGDVLFWMAASWYLLDSTHSRVLLGLLTASYAVGGGMSFLGGVLADSTDRRRLMIWVDLLRAIVIGVAAAGLMVHELPVWSLIATVFCVGLGGAVFDPAMGGLLPTVAEPDQIVGANGLMQSGAAAASLIGTAFAGIALMVVKPFLLMVGDAMSFAISSVSLVAIGQVRQVAQTVAARKNGTAPGWLAELKAGRKALWSHPVLLRFLPTAVMTNLGLIPLSILDVALVQEVMHRGADVYGLMGVVQLGGVLVGGAISGLWRRLPPIRVLFVCDGIMGAAMVAIALVPKVLFVCGDVALIGLASGVANAMGSTLMQTTVEAEFRSRVMGLFFTIAKVASPLGAAAVGVLASIIPVTQVFLLGGVLALASVLPILRLAVHPDAGSAVSLGAEP